MRHEEATKPELEIRLRQIELEKEALSKRLVEILKEITDIRFWMIKKNGVHK